MTPTINPKDIIGKSEVFVISDLRYIEKGNQITCTITNSSTGEKSSIVVYAVLFDKTILLHVLFTVILW
jgi:hypothetical protein